ncbi:MAG: CDP-2,3-bis-(O-geranylgeranyl)-sn-glycerol synthase [Candidatus Micrarchaeia archaeon]|jgi:CDP-2,3-bis-(O-geranylgeranyl)-sn-glycerol synthase
MEEILNSLIYILPAYFANSSPVVFGGGTPIDFNKKIFGKKIFGTHKTWRGFFAGLLVGTFVGAIESIFIGEKFLFVAFFLALGALIGDLFGSFVKRQLSIEEGKDVEILDQIPFIIFAILFGYLASNAFGFWLLSPFQILFLIVFTYFIHKFVNFVYMRYFPWIKGILR